MHSLRSLRMAMSVAAALIVSTCHADAPSSDPAALAGLHGGLIVQLGGDDTQAAAELSLTGRYLIHVLDSNTDTIQSARSKLRKDGHYGLTWAEQPVDADRLPYAENMVNLIVIRDYTVPVTELSRVLTPGDRSWSRMRKSCQSHNWRRAALIW